MSLLSRLMCLIAVALLPAMGAETYTLAGLRREREAALRDQLSGLLAQAEAGQEKLVKDTQQLLHTVGQLDPIINTDPPGCQALLERLGGQGTAPAELGIADRRGRVWCATKPAMVGADLSAHDYVQRAAAKAGAVAGGQVRPGAEGRAVRAFALALAGNGPAPAGVVIAHLPVPSADPPVPETLLPDGADVTVTDRSGAVLAHAPAVGGPGSLALSPEVRARLAKDARRVIELEASGGERRLVAYSPPAGPEGGVAVAASIDLRRALAPVQAMAMRDALLFGGAILLALALAGWGADRLVRQPVAQLMATARRWSAGDFGARVRFAGQGVEFAELGRAFDSLAEALQDRAQAHEKAYALERKMAAVLESTTDMVFELDRNGRFIYLNERARAEIGGGRDLIGISLRGAFPAAHGRLFVRYFRRAMAEQVPVEFEASYPPLGAWYSVRAFPSRDGLAVYFQNVTDRRRLEESLRRSGELLDRVLETLPVGVSITDQSGRVARVNPAMRRIWGGRWPADMEWLSGFRGWWADDGRPVRPDDWASARAVRKGEVSLGEIIDIECFDGSRKTILNSALPLRDNRGRIIGAIAVNEDITDWRRAEDELRKARDEAERANAAKSKFLAAASHDLRQPLQSLFLFAAALRPHLRNDRASEIHLNLERGLEALKGLLDSLLDVSRLDAGQIERRIEDFPIDDLLGQIDAGYRPIAEGKPLSWNVALCGRTVRSDPTLLGRMLRNLVENAIRYTPEGGIALRCRVEGASLWIEVADTGIGIATEHLDEIFAEFTQLGNPERDRQQGLGLGLAIVRRLSRLLGHRVAVASTPGQGSVFAIEVPLAAAAIAEAEPPALSHPAGRGKLIALVDDDAIVLLGLETVLREWGYDVVAETTGEAALERLLRIGREPDVVIADYRLRNGAVGTDVIQGIRREYGQEVPGLVLTGETGTEVLRKVAELGIGILHKPATPDRLNELVAKLCEASEARRSAKAEGA